MMAIQAPMHTVPMRLFELRDKADEQYTATGRMTPGYPGDTAGLRIRAGHHVHNLRQYSQVTAERFSQGRLSRRRQQIEQLRKLRAKNHSNDHRARGSKKAHSMERWPRSDSASSHGYRGKNCRAMQHERVPADEVGNVERGTGSGTGTAPSSNTSTSTATMKNVVKGDDFINDVLGLNPWCKSVNEHPRIERQRHHLSTRPQIRSFPHDGSIVAAPYSSPALDDSHTAADPRVIPSVRSTPFLLRSRKSRRLSVLQDSYSNKQSNHGREERTVPQTGLAKAASCETFLPVPMIPSGTDDKIFHEVGCEGNNQIAVMEAEVDSAKKSEWGSPSSTNTCNGVLLRLSPADRPLDPWDQLVGPLRAMCDIDPSLSRAGIEYRTVIPAVEVAREIMSQDEIKRKMIRDAKSVLGRDIRPRSSEAGLRASGITAELDVMKAIVVRERLLVTLRRLVRRLCRHCTKLQACVRREAKFRRRHGKAPSESITCATNVMRGTMLSEQQELRVVIAHIRAISINAVEAVTTWRATLTEVNRPSHDQPRARPVGIELKQPADRGYTFTDRTEPLSPPRELRHCTKANICRTSEPGFLCRDGAGVGSWAEIENAGHTDSDALSDVDEHAMNESISKSRCPPTFFWKARNYLDKMRHDLEFLTDESIISTSSPIATWLGFSAHRNPFLIPPRDFDSLDTLRLEHERRRESAAGHRTQCRRETFKRRQSDSGTILLGLCSQQQQPASSPVHHANAVRDEVTADPAETSNGGMQSGIRTEASTASGTTGVLLPNVGLHDVEGDDSTDLSSGEEEEVRWAGGGCLDAPIVPPLPGVVLQKARESASVLEAEYTGEKQVHRRTRQLLNNTARTMHMLEESRTINLSRVETIARRSLHEDLHSALKDRHIGSKRLRSLGGGDTMLGWGGQLRLISTAPADSGRRAGEKRSKPHGNDRSLEEHVFSKRAGLRVSTDGWEEGDNKPSCRASVGNCTSGEHDPASSDRTAELQDTSSSSVNTLCPEDSEIGSLQASISSISARARTRAVADRPTATRRPRKRPGKIVIMDPAKSAAIGEKAALLIQAVFFGVRARSVVRRLKNQRERAAVLIGRVARGWMARVNGRKTIRTAEAQRLRQQAEARIRDRAAHLITTFFRDIVYRNRRERRAIFLRDRERILKEIQEQEATSIIQRNARRLQASWTVKAKRHDRRCRAQIRIAQAARERAVYTQERQEKAQEHALLEEQRARVKHRMATTSDVAAIQIQAWLRGVYTRRVVAMWNGRTKVRDASARGRTSLEAALTSLAQAQSAAREAGKTFRRCLTNRNSPL